MRIVARGLARAAVVVLLTCAGCFHALDGENASKKPPGTGDEGMGDSGVDAGNDAGVHRDSGVDAGNDASVHHDSGVDAGNDASVHHDSGVDAGSDAGMDAGSTDVPRNRACTGATARTTVLLSEGFESYPQGPIYMAQGSSWIEAEASRDGAVTATWAHSGVGALFVDSFTTSTEWLYRRLELDVLPSRITIELWYTPDGSFVYKDYAQWGLAKIRSKFELTPVLALRGADHSLLLDDAPTAPVAGSTATGTEVFTEIEYSKQALGPEPPMHNYVRLEIDLCTDRASLFAGPTSNAPMKPAVKLAPPRAFDAFYISGGLNPTYLDDIVITVEGADL